MLVSFLRGVWLGNLVPEPAARGVSHRIFVISNSA
jgi:hypothetical protein